MVLAMGVGAWMAGLFHLITHAFFKALLFLGSGSVIYAAHHEQEMPQYGGLLKKIPVTAITFGIGVLAIAGTPYLSGYLSKDHILIGAALFAAAKAEATGSHWYWIYFAIPSAVAYLTAFYMMRCWTLTFAGKPRNHHVHDHAHEAPVMWWPLVVLAALSIGGGYIFVPSMLRNTMAETKAYCKVDAFKTANSHRLDPAEPEFTMREHGAEAAVAHEGAEAVDEEALKHAESLVLWYVYAAFVVGIGGAYLIYRKGYQYTDKMMQFAPFWAVHTFLRRKMFFDELYNAVLVGGVRTISVICGTFDKYVVDGVVNLFGYLTRAFSFLAGVHDKYVVDGAVIGSGQLAWGIGSLARGAQTGRVRGYVTLMLLVLAAGLLTVMAFYLA
jgi:NADH-quinone oxidoreductase subunit L